MSSVMNRTVNRTVNDREPRCGMRDDRGEGVISAAIAVLVMAGIGALMWRNEPRPAGSPMAVRLVGPSTRLGVVRVGAVDE
jgi:hypothetical protein